MQQQHLGFVGTKQTSFECRRACGEAPGSRRQQAGRSRPPSVAKPCDRDSPRDGRHRSGRLKRRQQLLGRVNLLVIAAVAAGRSGGVERRAVRSREAEIRKRGWSLGIPDSGIGLCNEWPDSL